MDSMGLRESVVGLAVHRTDPCGISYGVRERVRALVREAMFQFGLGRKDPDVPLADVVEPGMTVLLKPNWVLHRNEGGASMDCMVTHPAVIEAVLEEVLLARPGRVILGDAPIQACQFDTLVPAAWREALRCRSEIPLDVLDFRRHRLRGEDLAQGVVTEARPEGDYVLFDLGSDSLLEPITRADRGFRVTNYDHHALAETHAPGRHQYLLCREAFTADVILSLPKLKTHRKAGLTAALKNLVGINGNKDYLPHHRVGGSFWGGDCYPGASPAKRLAEFCLDRANRNINHAGYHRWSARARRILRCRSLYGDAELEGGWHGNDTTWRMVLDLNRLLLYGRPDGTLSDAPVRRVFSLTDALIAGEGEGPLAAEPLELGVVTFAASSAFADLVHCALLRFDPARVPLVREAFGRFRYPLTQSAGEACCVRALDRELTPVQVAVEWGRSAKPPVGWRGRVEVASLPAPAPQHPAVPVPARRG
jgi:uncharacterized protein (DUF362 family)